MNINRINQLIEVYRDGLLNDTLPFWLKESWDRELGGIMTCVDREGSVIDTDKNGWFQGRAAWTYATAYLNFDQNPEYLEMAKSLVGFIKEHGEDPEDGRLWYHYTREGQPIRKRRYSFTESFASIAMAAVAKATDDKELAQEAIEMFNKYTAYNEAGAKPEKFTGTRPLRGMGVPMIDIVTAQELRKLIDLPGATEHIDACIDEIKTYFIKDDIECVMETVNLDGSISDHMTGRELNPGHAIEGAWFIMNEGKIRGRQDYIDLGLKMLDWMWARGWDKEHGGILYYRDVYNKPCSEYWQDMKFWWPHNETIIATLLAYQLTGDEKYAEWHEMIHDWTYAHFPDKESGEWYGYLDRTGRVTTEIKGNMFKGPFHMPRMQMICTQILEEIKEQKG